MLESLGSVLCTPRCFYHLFQLNVRDYVSETNFSITGGKYCGCVWDDSSKIEKIRQSKIGGPLWGHLGLPGGIKQS